MSELTQDVLREWLRYDPETGMFFWRRTKGNVWAGTRAGCPDPPCPRRKPARRVTFFGRKYFEHRLAFFYVTGRWPVEIDHRNGDALDNRWANLREATRAENEANKGARKSNRSGLKGVSVCGSRFAAWIYRRGRHRYLGIFDTPEEAHAAYWSAAKKFDGEFARAG